MGETLGNNYNNNNKKMSEYKTKKNNNQKPFTNFRKEKKKNPKPRIEITVLNNSSENETDTFYIIISTLNIHLASNGDLGSIKRGRLWSSSYLVQYEVKT